MEEEEGVVGLAVETTCAVVSPDFIRSSRIFPFGLCSLTLPTLYTGSSYRER